MDDLTAQKLATLTSQFYAKVHKSFSETRASAWLGWQRVLEIAQAECSQPFSVLDVACGNLRFERFLEEHGASMCEASGRCEVCEVVALDNCQQLVGSADSVRSTGAVESADSADAVGSVGSQPEFSFPLNFCEVDILAEIENVSRETNFKEGSFESSQLRGLVKQNVSRETNVPNFTVCFGFMHHIPKPKYRVRLLHELVCATRVSGIVAVSFWQFAHDERLLRKAQEATKRGVQLLDLHFSDKNDYLLGWQDEQNIFRYCHNYTEQEIDTCVAQVAEAAKAAGRNVREVARFSADGRTDDLNRYVILKVES